MVVPSLAVLYFFLYLVGFVEMPVMATCLLAARASIS